MEEYRNLLVAVAGLTPQVITEMLFYLTVRHQPPIPVSEIHVVTTQPGKEHILQSLLAPGTGKFYTFCTEYDLDPTSIAFDAAHVHVLTDAADVPLDDIRSKICITPGREVFRQPGFGLTLLKSSARSGVLIDSGWDPHLIQVRDGVSINRDSLTAEGGRKFDFEVVPPGVRFRLSLVLDNPEDYEIGLLLRALMLFDEGFAFLGGHSSRGMGRVSISVEEIVRVDARRFLLGEPSYTEAIDRERYYEALRTKLEGQQTERADHV